MTFINHLGALTLRNILKNLRNPDIVVFATAAPVAFALLFAYVFGSAMEMSGDIYREYLLVGILAQTMLMTSTNTGIGLAMDNRLFRIEGVGGGGAGSDTACRGPGRGRGLPMMGVLTLPIRKTSTCLTLPSLAPT